MHIMPDYEAGHEIPSMTASQVSHNVNNGALLAQCKVGVLAPSFAHVTSAWHVTRVATPSHVAAYAVIVQSAVRCAS